MYPETDPGTPCHVLVYPPWEQELRLSLFMSVGPAFAERNYCLLVWTLPPSRLCYPAELYLAVGDNEKSALCPV